jgi:hypothetical protein
VSYRYYRQVLYELYCGVVVTAWDVEGEEDWDFYGALPRQHTGGRLRA